MKLIHSFSTKTCPTERLKVHIYCFVLSCLYAKQSGFEIVLHTDKRGAELLSIAPYDKIITDLEYCNIPNKKIFAWAKYEALKDEDANAIHIDGDVFLKKETMKEILSFDDCDVIVQQVEIDGMYNWGGWENSTIAFARCEYPTFLPRNCSIMYNCGVVGFKDKKVRDEYISYYNDLISQYNKIGVYLDSVPDLVAEQQLLYYFAKHKNLKVKEILNYKDIQGSAKDIGYQHLLGDSKFRNFDKIKQMINILDNNIYNKLKLIQWD